MGAKCPGIPNTGQAGYGGGGGKYKIREITFDEINRIEVRVGEEWLHGLRVLGKLSGARQELNCGGGGQVLSFDPRSPIVEVRVRCGYVVDGIQFICQDGSKSQFFGYQTGGVHTVRPPSGEILVGFKGSADEVLHRIDFVWDKPQQTLQGVAAHVPCLGGKEHDFRKEALGGTAEEWRGQANQGHHGYDAKRHLNVNLGGGGQEKIKGPGVSKEQGGQAHLGVSYGSEKHIQDDHNIRNAGGRYEAGEVRAVHWVCNRCGYHLPLR